MPRLFSPAVSNYAVRWHALGAARSFKGSRTLLANGRNKYFALIARDSVSRPFDIAQSACLPRLALRAWWSGRTGGGRLAPLPPHSFPGPPALLPRRFLRAGAGPRR